MNYETSRRHPRSMAEAFADERAGCIEGPHKRGDTIKGYLLAIAIGLGVVAALTQWWTA